jgi:phospho-N-acetylmuramoyl-pentapeptide-transferase
MLLSFAQWLQSQSPEFGFLRVFQYQTFRAVMAAMTALLMGLAAGPYVIRRLAELKIGQPIREYAMASHLSKKGTPTMGGVLILLCIAVAPCCGSICPTALSGSCCWSPLALVRLAGWMTGARW